MPSADQGRIISAKFSDINSAIRNFGGSALSSDSPYYTSSTSSTSDGFENCIYGSGGSLTTTGNSPFVRGVRSTSDSAAIYWRDPNDLKLSVIINGERKFLDKQEYEEMKTEIDTEPKTSLFEQAKFSKTSDAIKALNANKDSQLILFEPRAFAETQDIANYLKLRKAAVVNLHRLQKEQSKRVVDFLSGVIYAIEGDIQRIGPRIFLCTPKNIGVSGTIDLDDEEADE